jgi:hypothetical protein
VETDRVRIIILEGCATRGITSVTFAHAAEMVRRPGLLRLAESDRVIPGGDERSRYARLYFLTLNFPTYRRSAGD